ncbi:uncharacterized protein BX664DRAFT_327899 [Halteromyces radiatus]|uniref:uncharacterized protein n=1 Tax=Halteromyces radiatus TaxID=101107 RepID=UPI00221EF93B|nr:uncharacterized protein BX664DRAFT_327899 [Halteromyces radiatus]KAI8092683.1 hypothetical protein BX664DRAFT_327899 [Halteromyces radiatus]
MIMANPSPLPNSYSPKDQPPRSAFQWPAPLSPRFNKQDDFDTTATNTDLSLKEILDKYKDDADILRHILLAKAEEDKRQAARDMLKTEQARIHLKQLDLEYLREQSRLSRHDDKSYHQNQSTIATAPPSATTQHLPPPPGTPSYAYGLAPVQQQVLARLTGNHPDTHYSSNYSSNYEYQPSSPVAYPHSAHPLCPPTEIRTNNNNKSSTAVAAAAARYNHPGTSNSTPVSAATSSSIHYRHRLPPPSINTSTSAATLQPSAPVSPAVGANSIDDSTASIPTRYKRNRHSASDQSDDKLSHNKVMEALKAKIQRGNGSPISTTPTSSLPYRSNFADSLHMDKRQRQLPKPIVSVENNNNNKSSTSSASTTVNSITSNGTGPVPSTSSSSAISPSTTSHTPSPRSAKPILPPIDTSVGRNPHHPHHPHHHHQQQQQKQQQKQQQQQRHRSSSPPPRVSTSFQSTSKISDIPTSTPTTVQISPSDQVLALSTHHRQGRSSGSQHSTPPEITYKQESSD